jgi:hypothetical protein
MLGTSVAGENDVLPGFLLQLKEYISPLKQQQVLTKFCGSSRKRSLLWFSQRDSIGNCVCFSWAALKRIILEWTITLRRVEHPFQPQKLNAEYIHWTQNSASTPTGWAFDVWTILLLTNLCTVLITSTTNAQFDWDLYRCRSIARIKASEAVEANVKKALEKIQKSIPKIKVTARKASKHLGNSLIVLTLVNTDDQLTRA